MHRLSVEAHAKINLSLEVTGRRGDGFHDLVSIFQAVALADRLQLATDSDLSLTCSEERLERDDNLVLRAARLLQRRYGVLQGCRIDLEKRIPVAAGLGGGSSDAAAALVGLTHLWSLHLTCDELVTVAAELGSDVPFFLYGGTALVEGRGERISPLPRSTATWYVLVKPPISVPTARIFAELSPDEWSDGSYTQSLAQRLRLGGPVETGMNTLQEPLFRLYPEVRAVFNDLQAIAPGRVVVSGSGATICVVLQADDAAWKIVESLSGRGYWVATTTSCPPGGWETLCASPQ
jgi:4-diphosphocytidyl-2-C-methyl-D-erythritol kinase